MHIEFNFYEAENGKDIYIYIYIYRERERERERDRQTDRHKGQIRREQEIERGIEQAQLITCCMCTV